MVPTHSTEVVESISPQGRETLLDLAVASIRHGLDGGGPLPIDSSAYCAELQARRACFVTLNRHHALRGCIGHLEAFQPLVSDVVESARSAAFGDPRFPPLSEPELGDLEIHISVLTPSQEMAFASEQDLIAQLHSGVDGLILVEGGRRGTFLPSVREQLPRPDLFIRHLKQKAGLPPDHWSEQIRIFRYRTESFGRP
ncbi:MAG: AmmeMemoRadiSam system protein A [gamma proteobacterium symbiont of Phacoides pectinatus]